MMIKVLFLAFGVLLTLWGIHRMKNDDALIGKTQKQKNIFNLIFLDQASGIGQFLSGIVCIIIGIIFLIMK